MRRVTFLGTALTEEQREHLADEIPADAEIWAVNEAHWGLGDRKPARVFQLHVRDWREAERRFLGRGRLPKGLDHNCFGRDRGHVEYLRTCGVPVYCQQQWDDIPTCVVYPFEGVTEVVGISLPPHGNKRLWATSSFGYMAALALAEFAESTRYASPMRIQLIGVELPGGTQRERVWEWPNLAYYLGVARGFGIEIELPSWGSALLSAPHYALGAHPMVYDADHWWVPGYSGVILDEDDGVLRLGTTDAWGLPK